MFCIVAVFGGFSSSSGTQSSGFGAPTPAAPFGGSSATLTFGAAAPATTAAPAPAFGAPTPAQSTTASGTYRVVQSPFRAHSHSAFFCDCDCDSFLCKKWVTQDSMEVFTLCDCDSITNSYAIVSKNKLQSQNALYEWAGPISDSGIVQTLCVN